MTDLDGRFLDRDHTSHDVHDPLGVDDHAGPESLVGAEVLQGSEVVKELNGLLELRLIHDAGLPRQLIHFHVVYYVLLLLSSLSNNTHRWSYLLPYLNESIMGQRNVLNILHALNFTISATCKN